MNFLAPWAAWFLAGLPVIVLLYLLKVRRQPMPVSTLIFWQKVLEENRRRAFFQKLRHLLSLLLQLLIFLLVVGALAKPAFQRAESKRSSTVLIFDQRARMLALEPGGQTRFEKALQLAVPYLQQADLLNPVAVLGTDSTTTVISPFSGEEKPLRQSLTALRATETTGQLQPAIHLAEELLASQPEGARILVFTDSVPPEKLSTKVPVEYIATGTEHDNLAITRFATRSLPNSPETSEVLLELQNFGRNPAQGNIELAFDGKLLDVKPFQLEPGARKLEFFPSLPRSNGRTRGWLTARIDQADALAVDNLAFAILPPIQPSRVLLISKGNWFLEKLLEANPQLTYELLTPETFRPEMARGFSVILFDNCLPAELSATEGNFLYINQSPFGDLGPALSNPIIPEADSAHPIMRLVNWQNVNVLQGRSVPIPPNSKDWTFETPLRSFDQAMMLTASRPKANGHQRTAVLGFDPAQSDLPLRIAFPLLLANTIHWLAGDENPAPLQVLSGESFPLAPDQRLWTQPQTDPAKSPTAPEPSALAQSLFQPKLCGYYLLQQGDKQNWIAVNTFSDAESDLRRELPAAPAALPKLRSGLPSLGGWALWQLLALAALLLSSLEWWLFHRRRTE